MKHITRILAAALLCGCSLSASAVNPLEAITGIVGAVTATDKFEVSSLEGTWKYTSPAITFKSDNAVNNIGGAAASATIEAKLASYYKKLGLNTAVFTFDAEGNFTLALKKVTLKGTVTKNDDAGALTFNFASNSGYNIGAVSAFATKDATGVLQLTFDASRVIDIVTKVAEYANNSTLSTVSTMLNSYDNIYAGAKFKKK